MQSTPSTGKSYAISAWNDGTYSVFYRSFMVYTAYRIISHMSFMLRWGCFQDPSN